MNTATISRTLIGGKDDLVVLPRREYEELLSWKTYKEFTPTKTQINALRRAERNLKAGKLLTCEQLASKMGLTH